MPFHVRCIGSTPMGGLNRWCYEITVDGEDSFEENFCYGLDFPPGVKIRKARGSQMQDAPGAAADVSGPWTVLRPDGTRTEYYVAFACPKPREKSITICLMARGGENPSTEISLQKVFDEAVDTTLWRDISYEGSVMRGPAAS